MLSPTIFELPSNYEEGCSKSEKAILPNGENFYCDEVELTEAEKKKIIYESNSSKNILYLTTPQYNAYYGFLDFINQLKILKEDLLEPNLPNGRSVIKEYKKFATKKNIVKKYIDYGVKCLEDHYSISSLKRSKLYVSVSTDLDLTLKLGLHKDLDKGNSCLGSTHEFHKFINGLVDNFVTFFLSEKKITKELILKDKAELLGRAFGILTKEHLLISNFYGKRISQEEVKVFFEIFYKKKFNPNAKNLGRGAYLHVYSNGDGILFGEKHPKNGYLDKVSKENAKIIEAIRTCEKDDWDDDDYNDCDEDY